MKATNLRVEYMTNPIGIDYVCPRFSWIFEQGTKQTAYQIIAKDDFGNLLWCLSYNWDKLEETQ